MRPGGQDTQFVTYFILIYHFKFCLVLPQYFIRRKYSDSKYTLEGLELPEHFLSALGRQRLKNFRVYSANFRRVLNIVCFLLVIPQRLNFIHRRFGTLCLFHLHRQVGMKYTHLPMKMEQTECSETSAYKIQTPGNYPEESYLFSKCALFCYTAFTSSHCSVIKFTSSHSFCQRAFTSQGNHNSGRKY